MLEVIRQDYVRTAKAKGISDRLILTRHILSNVMIPVITHRGPFVSTPARGVVITETIFSIPGLGRLIVDAIRAQDYPVVQGSFLRPLRGRGEPSGRPALCCARSPDQGPVQGSEIREEEEIV
ncbi:hypothetical protein MASR2M17_24430 [Aminivibrio sp.]